MTRAIEAGLAPLPLRDDPAVEAAGNIQNLATALPANFNLMRDGLEKILHNLRLEMVWNPMPL